MGFCLIAGHRQFNKKERRVRMETYKCKVSPDQIETRVNKEGTYYFFKLPTEKFMYYYMGQIETNKKTSADFEAATRIRWLDVPKILRENLYLHLTESDFEVNPYSYEEEKIRFVYFGDEVTIHAELHRVLSPEITTQLMMTLGNFDRVRLIREISRHMSGNDYVDYHYIIDEKFFVVVTDCSREGYYPPLHYEIWTYADIKERDKLYGKKATVWAINTGVPWEIALLACNHQDADTIEKFLNTLKEARGTANSEIREELKGDIYSRLDAFGKLLDFVTWKSLNCAGEWATKVLADFLLEER
jgi:hypothetical protein